METLGERLVCRTLKEQALVSTLRSVPGTLSEGNLTAHLKLSAENQNGEKLSKTNKKNKWLFYESYK